MNKLINIAIVVMSLIFASCCTTKKISEKVLQKNAPFKIVKATYNNWVGEQPGVKGLRINITIDNPEIELDSAYFRSSKTKLDRVDSSEASFVGIFNTSNSNRDIIMHRDPEKEYGNTPPIISPKIPFELQKNEAVVSYIVNGETQYYKISELKEIKKD